MSVVAVPITSTEFDMIGRIIEDMTYYSYDIITPAYKEIQLKSRDSRDEESSAMIDIIFSSMRLDLAFAFQDCGLSLVNDLRAQLTNFDAGIVSFIDANKDKYNAQLNSILSSLE